MAGWLALLKLVPWAEVISNAPAVADGAKKLWSTVAKKRPLPETSGTSAAAQAPAPQAMAALEERLAVVEAAAVDLHSQMLASSELIKALADQNAQLIKRVEINRTRVVWLAVATGAAGIIAAVSLVVVLVR